jgi:tRNA pseudouridine55 synthase
LSIPALGGLLLIDKPSGPTSHDLVSRVRRAAGMRRVGHAGTLDPLATGLLPIVLGQATRLIRFIPASPKRYTGSLRLGATSDTDDAAGDISEVEAPLPDADLVVSTARQFEGESQQVPPNYSARHVDGQRMYKLARQGRAVTAPARPIHVSCFELQPTDEPHLFSFVAEVTGGTYIRALARDLGARLGCGGLLQSLRRTRIGELDVSGAHTVPSDADPDWVRERLTAPSEMALGPPPTRLDSAADVASFRQGQKRRWEGANPPDGWLRVLDPEGQLLGLASVADGLLQPRVVLPG